MKPEPSPHERAMIPVAKTSFDEVEERMVTEVLRSGWVTQGPKVADFERAFAQRVGAAEAVAVSSGTTALFLALYAGGIGEGDEVIVPSLSFIATANVVVQCGAVPVFVDVDLRTYNLDPAGLGNALTPRTRAIMPVHQLGLPADLDRINEFAAKHGLLVVEDAACAAGSAYKNKPIGGSGNLVCFSFHPRKILVTGEGGMITTDNTDLATRLRRLRHQGMSVSDLQRHQADTVLIEEYPEVGFNFRLSDLQAAMGLAQLAKMDAFVAERRRLANRYTEALADIPEIDAPFIPEDAEPNYQSYIVRLRGAEANTRNAFMNEMLRRRVTTRRGLMAIHRESCYANANISGSLKNTDAATDQTVILPLYAGFTQADQDYVIDQLADALAAVRGKSTSWSSATRTS
jgi:dTDP-4-amino-4,6-dideoxygalactose transaminase